MGSANREFIVEVDGEQLRVPRKRTRANKSSGKPQFKEKFIERIIPPVTAKTAKQREYFRMLNDPSIQVIVVLGLHGTGKAQPLYSKVLTPSGYVNMADIKVGDTVRSQDNWTKVLGVFPQGLKPVYRFTMNDGSTVDSCEDHIWTIDTNASDKGGRIKRKVRKNVTTKEIVEILLNKVDGNVSLPKLSAVDYENVELPLHPYIVGALIGDGCITQSTPKISTVDVEILDTITQFLPEGCRVGQPDSRNITYSLVDDNASWVSENRITGKLKELGLHGKTSCDKFIPDVYKLSSVEQRTWLIKGLMDTDGTVNKGSASYCTISKKLAEDVKDIVLSLGGRASISKRTKNYFSYKGERKKGQDAYVVSINMNDKRELFTLERKKSVVSKTQWHQMVRNIEKSEYIGEVECQCIMVDDPTHLYVTDDYILTHNTYCASVTAADKFRKNEIEKIIVSRAYVQTGKTSGFKPGTSLEKLYPYVRNVLDTIKGRIGDGAYEIALKDGLNGEIEVQEVESIRGRSFDQPSFLIIDEAQQTTPDEMKSIVTRVSDQCKLVLCGDVNQKDIHGESGLEWFLSFVERHNIKGVGVINFDSPDDIVRGGLVKDIAIGLMKDQKKG